jgi:3-hydroxybutyryl-CoA dehydrogenase
MEIKNLAVIGSGTMGNGIAQVCAIAGLDVVMVDISNTAVERGLATIRSSLERLVKKGTLTAENRDGTLARIQGTTSYDHLKGVDLVIEAATERKDLKISILKHVEELVSSDAIIATNTSSISITELAGALAKPERFIGTHFFNPVPMMTLLELIRGLQTSEATHSQLLAFAAQLGKTAISSKNSPGFVVNRILVPMINEAIFVLQDGLASAEDIDAGMRLGCNHPIGPLALADMIGLDTLLAVMEVFYDGFSDSKYRPAPLLKEMVSAGWLGRKSGRGFYSY